MLGRDGVFTGKQTEFILPGLCSSSRKAALITFGSSQEAHVEGRKMQWVKGKTDELAIVLGQNKQIAWIEFP